jgi:hypothetical protein
MVRLTAAKDVAITWTHAHPIGYVLYLIMVSFGGKVAAVSMV